LRAIELFAGIGLMRAGLEEAGFQVVFANDIEPFKAEMYRENFDCDEFVLGDIRDLRGANLPDAELLTASFPCTDLSLAGNRAGLDGEQSGMFWEAIRLIGEMESRRPPVVLFENVPSFVTSNGGEDFRSAVLVLNNLGYTCDAVLLDAASWVPQSRKRLFLVGALGAVPRSSIGAGPRPQALRAALARIPGAVLGTEDLPEPPRVTARLAQIVERLRSDDPRWWPAERVTKLLDSMSPLQRSRIEQLRSSTTLRWRTAYRRTRRGVALWEARSDELSGCLRTARGGSSRQALLQIGRDSVRVRWMTPKEYGRLQGADSYRIPSTVTSNQALFAFGDAVCVPAVAWLANEYLRPTINGERPSAALQGRLVEVA